jgi:predicted DNA repair protein MutK
MVHGVPAIEHVVEGVAHALTERSAVLAFIATTVIDALVGIVCGAIAVMLFTLGKTLIGKGK